MSFGRLERSSGSQPMSDINMTPLVDVMLVLVVIFIITAPLLASAIKVDLPKAQGASTLAEPHFVAITMDEGGQIFVNDTLLDSQGLQARLQATATLHPDAEVRLRADANVPYGRVVEVMGFAHAAGLHRIGFVTAAATATATDAVRPTPPAPTAPHSPPPQ